MARPQSVALGVRSGRSNQCVRSAAMAAASPATGSTRM
jgi:hypothetical protein